MFMSDRLLRMAVHLLVRRQHEEMARYKVLKSVAHSLGHSFTSLMNYAHDDYVMGHILRFARASNRDTLIIDLMTGEADPAVLIQPPIEEVPGRYAAWLRDLVKTHQSDMRFVQAAGLTLRFDLQKSRTKRETGSTESPYVCDVVITDDRDKEYTAHFEGWWYPELPDTAAGEARP
jgi:hypothetical protein